MASESVELPLYSFVADQPCRLCGIDPRWREASYGSELVFVGYDGTVCVLGYDCATIHLAITDPVFWCRNCYTQLSVRSIPVAR